MTNIIKINLKSPRPLCWLPHSNSDCDIIELGAPKNDPSKSVNKFFFWPSQSISTQSDGLIRSKLGR